VKRHTIAIAGAIAALLLASGGGACAEDSLPGKRYESPILGESIFVERGVFWPSEAEAAVLPFMRAHPQLFRDKRVLEIGGGAGLIALYAAKLGAKNVVVTDISHPAVRTIRRNARDLGFGRVLEARIVAGPDTSAYAALQPGEAFDTIISNPPYSLDLDAAGNTAVIDTGDLGVSIVRELDAKLAPGGTAVLLYQSLFYHQFIVKYARQLGLAVEHHHPATMLPWQLEALFNSYLKKLLAREDIPQDAFEFDWERDDWGRLQIVVVEPRGGARKRGGHFPGIIQIRR
jgi:methylase of polypeptide subunit release factors